MCLVTNSQVDFSLPFTKAIFHWWVQGYRWLRWSPRPLYLCHHQGRWTRGTCGVFGSEKKEKEKKKRISQCIGGGVGTECKKTKQKQKRSAGYLPISLSLSLFILQWAGSYLPASFSVPLAVQFHGLWLCAIQQTKETCCIGSNNNNNTNLQLGTIFDEGTMVSIFESYLIICCCWFLSLVSAAATVSPFSSSRFSVGRILFPWWWSTATVRSHRSTQEIVQLDHAALKRLCKRKYIT